MGQKFDYDQIQDWAKTLAPQDIVEIIELSQLPQHELLLQIQNLLKTAYEFGIMEGREIIRGKYLGIYSNSKKRQQ